MSDRFEWSKKRKFKPRKQNLIKTKKVKGLEHLNSVVKHFAAKFIGKKCQFVYKY